VFHRLLGISGVINDVLLLGRKVEGVLGGLLNELDEALV
jgi:hypothetical protein